jgi:hypothetical protein
MRIIPCLLALATCVLFSGCTAIAVRGPVGEPAPEHVIDELVGTWIGERIDSIDSTVVFERVPDSGFLVARYKDDGELQEQRFLATWIADGSLVLWAETAMEGFLAPGRASLNEGSLIVLVPDNGEVQALVEKGVLTAAPEEADELYMIEPKGVEDVMVTKAFWKLDNALGLIKARVSHKESAEASTGEVEGLPAQPASQEERAP